MRLRNMLKICLVFWNLSLSMLINVMLIKKNMYVTPSYLFSKLKFLKMGGIDIIDWAGHIISLLLYW